MANTNLFIMSKGSKPGDTPTVATNPNAYYDTPTNPLVICTDTLTADTTVACYEIRNDDSFPKNGKPVATGVLVNNGSGYSTSVSGIVVDTVDPRIKFKVGHHIYKSDGTFIGTISSMTNTLIIFTANILTSLANNDELYTAQGVSNSDEYNILNRIYPDTAATSELYLENLENTPGYRILCAKYQSDGTTVSSGVSVSSIDLATDDYFVMLNADNPLNHHFAKITKVTTSDVAGDSFEFSPKFGSEIPKGTKFTIYKGPAVTDTAVVAVGYGLFGNAVNYGTDSDETDGTGTATDSRHAGMTYISTPLFFFYNDRLNKKNQLDHNTKYMLHYSRSDDGSETHYQRCFLTCQDYGLKVIDYGPYTMNATMVDMARSNDAIQYSGSTFSYAMDDTGSGAVNSYGSNLDVADWNNCFINNQRNTSDLKFGETWEGTDSALIPEGSFTGPTKYLHYDSSPDLSNIIPEVLELNVFESITESGGYVDARIVDSMRIYGTKIQDFDTIKIKKIINDGTLSNDYVGQLPGTITGSAGATNLEVQLTNIEQDVRVLLKSGSSFEEIKIGDYIYNINSIDAPNTSTLTQNIEIGTGRLPTTPYYDGSISNLVTTVTNGKYYRKPWSKICENLIVDFTIDTKVNYTNAGLTTQSETIVYGNNTSTTGSASGSRLYDAEIVLTSGKQTGLVFKIDYGDSNHNIIKLQTPRLQLYRSESANEANFLDYYNGRYTLYKTIFVGEVESLENYIEDGMLKYHLSGRNKINKLLGPIVNKDYKHSDDIIYSTIGPFEHITALGFSSHMASNTVNMVGNAGMTTLGTISGVSIGDLLFTQEGYFIGRIKDLTGGITLEEGSLVNLYDRVNTDSTQTLYVIRPNRNSISLAKAMSKNTITSNSVSSLKGAANKGLIFSSGNKLTDDTFGRPNLEGTTLIGTSSHTNANALGYHLHQPNSVNVDDSFFTDLKDEITPSNIEKHTVSSLTEYEIVNLESGNETTLIEVAPNCPIVMGRVDENPADVTLETLTISAYKFAGAESEGEYGVFTIDGAPADMYTALNDKHLYLSDGAYLGKMLGLEYKTASDAYITLDRKLPRAISANEYIYTSTQKTHGLYLINTQGLRSGGVLQLVNSELSTEGRPIIYNASLDTNSNGNLNFNDLSYRHGGFTYRYINLQKSSKGGIYYDKRKLGTGDTSNVYSRKKGEYNAYAPAYKIIPGIITSATTNNMGLNNDYTNSYEKQLSPPNRGIYSSSGGNFADHSIYPTGNLNVDYKLLPKKYSQSFGGNWNSNLSGTFQGTTNEDILGIKNNSISHAKDCLEIIDPKTTTPFLFAPSDFWPDSLTREHHIGNISRDFKDYGILLRSEPRKLISNIKHRNYSGEASYLEESDDLYQTLNIADASINTNEIRRLGLIRLIECTYDWHFNLVDPENPPEKNDLTDFLTYDRYQKVIASGIYVQSGGYATSDTVITTKDAASGGSAADPSTLFAASTNVWTDKGEHIGTVSSVNSTTITLNASAKKPNGSLYTGELYYLNLTAKGGETSNFTWYGYPLSGRGGKSTFTKCQENSSGRAASANPSYTNANTGQLKLHMLQSAIFNGKANVDDGGYGMGTDNEWTNYFVNKMDFADSDNQDVDKLHHLALPPVFGGFELIPMTFSAGGSTRTARVKMDATAGHTDYIKYSTAYDHSDTSSHNFAVDDKVYAENGRYIGKIAAISGHIDLSGNAAIQLDEPIKIDLDSGGSGLKLFTGSSGTGNGEAVVGANLGGYHPLGKKSEILTFSGSTDAGPIDEYVHSSRVLEGLQHDIPVRGDGTYVKEYFPGPITITGTTYAAVSGSPDTITSSANNFITAGIKKGMIIHVSGSSESANNTGHRVTNVAAGTLTLSTNTSLTNDSAGDTWTIKVVTGGEIQNSVYNSLRAVVLDNFKIEMAGDYAADIGATAKIATNFSDPTANVKMGSFYESTDKVYKHTFYALNTEEYFAHYKLTEEYDTTDARNEVILNSGSNSGLGENIATGIDVVFKPLLQCSTSNDYFSANFGYISPNGQSDLTQLIIDTSEDSQNKWLEFIPNLTGCYLVSNDGVRIDDEDVLSTSNVWTDSIESRYPNRIHYIVSHTIRTDTFPTSEDGLWNKHVLLIDNCDAADELFGTYRIMRPANVCLWPDSPTKLDLYKMSSKYTKKPNSKEMYEDIGDISYYENGFLKGENMAAGYNEGVQSMYVVANPDHTSTNNRFLIPRTTAGNHISELFGDGKTFNNRSYEMLMNDGIEKNRRNIIINTESKTISSTTYNYTVLDYNQPIENKMSGIVSLGEIFTLTSNQNVDLKNVKTASIGTTVSIGVEAEEIINDVLETNDVVYTDSDTTYPYFASPNIQGLDAYNTIKYLASFKDKEVLIDKGEIKLIENNAVVRYTDIEINENNNDIKVIEINQTKSKFDNYNEIIVYGLGVKSVRKNARSIKKHGKKTLEESNFNLLTQSDVDNRARALLALYSSNEKGVSVKIANSNLEWLKSGDIIIIDYPSEHIPRSEHIVLEVKHETSGILEIDTGTFSKELDSRLAEMIISQKKADSAIRGRKFKSPSATIDAFDSLKLKPIQIIATKSTVSGHTPLGLSTTLGFGTLLKIGTRTTTEVLREDLT